MNCGIYKITSPSGNFYIGSSCDIKQRLRKHRCAASRGDHYNKTLQRAFRKYGELKEEILLVCREQDLIFYEQLCIDNLKPRYNQSVIAGRSKVTKEGLDRIRSANRNRVITPETRAKISAIHKGKILSTETRSKISAAKKGRALPPFSQEHCANLSAAMKGLVRSPEHCANISAAKKRRFLTRD